MGDCSTTKLNGWCLQMAPQKRSGLTAKNSGKMCDGHPMQMKVKVMLNLGWPACYPSLHASHISLK